MIQNVPIIGSADVIFSGDGCRWWAERGLICYEKVDNSYGTLTVREALVRVKGLNELVGDRRFGKGFHTGDEVKQNLKFVEGMIQLCKKAQAQGMPDDPTAVRDLKRRRKKTVRISTKFTQF